MKTVLSNRFRAIEGNYRVPAREMHICRDIPETGKSWNIKSESLLSVVNAAALIVSEAGIFV